MADSLSLGSALIFTSDLEQIVGDILDHLQQVVPYDVAAVAVLEADHLRRIAVRGDRRAATNTEIKPEAEETLFNEIRRLRRPLCVADTAEDTRFAAADEFGAIRAWIGLPLLARGEVFGWLTLGRWLAATYGEHSVALAEPFAQLIATALVSIQQADLLRALYRARIDEQENARAQLADELHDQILTLIAGMAINVDDKSAGPGFHEAFQMVTARLRRAIDDLSPALLLRYDLTMALDKLAKELSARSAGKVAVEVDVAGSASQYPEPVAQCLYRIVEQVADNALRHAQSHSIRIHGRLDPDTADLSVEDDGVGFPGGKVPDLLTLVQQKRFGLAEIMERAQMIGAEVRIDTAAAEGTRVHIRWTRP